MNFLYPAFLLGALAIAIPIALHLLRRDVAPELPFSAVRLLKRSPIEQTRRRRLRDLILLAARVAALLLLAAAFARPYRSAGDAGEALRIIAVDRSYSMGAPGRFTRALTIANDAIAEAGRGRVAVIAFDDRADVIANAGSAADARAALADLTPGFGATRYDTVLLKAIEVADRNPARLIIVTDMQRAGWENAQPIAAPAGMQVEIREAGTAANNVSVGSVRILPDVVMATLRNSGAASFAGDARLIVDGRPLAVERVTIEAGATADARFSYAAPRGASVSVAIDDPDGYVADNTRYAVFGDAGRTRVLILAGGAGESQPAFYLTRALDAFAGDAEFDTRVTPGASFVASGGELTRGDVVVLLTTRGLDRRGRERLAEFVRGGGGLLVAAAADVDAATLTATMNWPALGIAEGARESAVLAATDLRHPIFRPFGALAANLGQVRFDRTWRVRADDWDVAARFNDGSPAVLERREGSGRVLLFASDVDRRWNDFPLHPSFVPFVVESIRYVAGERETTTDFLIANTPSGVRPEPGVHKRSDARLVAVNVDARESSTARITQDEFRAMLTQAAAPAAQQGIVQAQQSESRQGLWRYGLMLMLGVLVLESFVGRR
jgi:hypothetical protein